MKRYTVVFYATPDEDPIVEHAVARNPAHALFVACRQHDCWSDYVNPVCIFEGHHEDLLT